MVALPALLLFTAGQKNNLNNGKVMAAGPEIKAAIGPTAAFPTLVWSDEFDSTAFNTNNWVIETGGNGWGNNEKQFYQSSNATLDNGNLVITAKKETVNNNGYTSARLKTQGKKEFTYGKNRSPY